MLVVLTFSAPPTPPQTPYKQFYPLPYSCYIQTPILPNNAHKLESHRHPLQYPP